MKSSERRGKGSRNEERKGSERMMWEKGSSGKAGEDLRWLRIKEGTGKSREPGWRGGANGEIRDDRIKAIKEGSRKKGSDD